MEKFNTKRDTELKREHISAIVEAALKEDIGRADITTDALIPRAVKVDANIVAKETGIVCGLELVEMVFQKIDANVRFKAMAKDGDAVEKEKAVCFLSGSAASILKGERVALNFLGHLSGIATLTRRFAEKVNDTSAKIMDTRKTTPLLRELEKYAVKCGGGYNHRMGLHDQVLVKDNHLFIVRRSELIDKKKPLFKEMVRELRKKILKGVKVEIEVDSLEDFSQAFVSGADIIMLDNMKISDMKEAVRQRNASREHRAVILETSGNVTLENVREIALTGVDQISVGALTHSAPALDFSLEII